MEQIVSKRPKGFQSINDAISWAIQSRTLLNKKSAMVSIPPQLEQKIMSSGETGYVWKND